MASRRHFIRQTCCQDVCSFIPFFLSTYWSFGTYLCTELCSSSAWPCWFISFPLWTKTLTCLTGSLLPIVIENQVGVETCNWAAKQLYVCLSHKDPLTNCRSRDWVKCTQLLLMPDKGTLLSGWNGIQLHRKVNTFEQYSVRFLLEMENTVLNAFMCCPGLIERYAKDLNTGSYIFGAFTTEQES